MQRNEKFVVIVEDIKKLRYIRFFGKDRGKTLAQQIERKFSRKVGPTLVLTISEVYASGLLLEMYPEPSVNVIYREHPYENERLIELNKFHKVVTDDKRHSYIYIYYTAYLTSCS